MDALNAFTVQSNNTLLMILLATIAGSGVWFMLRRNPRLTNVVIYTALVIWLLSLLAAFIWRS